MSDEIFEVSTSSTDVAELGQSYIDRVDGERILLPLPLEVPAGEGVRFIVHLVDGTPAFAGSGRCVQASDQGDQVPATDRFETLIDTLAFDERSLPVYEYIVAVRQLAYSDNASPEAENVAVNAGGEETTIYADAEPTQARPEVTVVSEEPAELPRESQESLAPVAAVEALPSEPLAPTPAPPKLDLDGETQAIAVMQQSEPVRPRVASEPPSLVVPAGPIYASVKPEPLPTGMLTRPAIALHWAPAAPRPPQRSLRPSNFQTARGPLAIPAAPPRPDLDRSLWVTRADRPAA